MNCISSMSHDKRGLWCGAISDFEYGGGMRRRALCGTCEVVWERKEELREGVEGRGGRLPEMVMVEIVRLNERRVR